MASITLNNINKTYPGNVTAVSDFNLEIADKEFLILVGPSGCGKSTTLRMIAGLEDITAGAISIGERLVNDVAPKDRDIAMVFQNYALYPHMSVYDNIAFGLKMRRMPKLEIRDRVEKVAEQLEIFEFLKRRPAALSGGQRQRVALGRAMVREPAVFLLDEPLSNLDAKLRSTMRAEIMRLHKQMKTTFVYVTHDQTEAMTMGDRIVVMKDGFIQQVDTPLRLYRHPCNLFVASFIGSPRMNLLPAVPRRGGQSGLLIETAEQQIPLSKSATAALKPYLGQEMILGIRPEDIPLLDESAPGAIAATVELSELLGAESFLHLNLNGYKLVVRTLPLSPAEGETVFITFPPAAVHLFNKASEETVLCRAEG